MAGLDDFIIEQNPEAPRRFNVYMPRPINSLFLEFVGRYAFRLPLFSSGSVHLLAVANSGVPVATAILDYRRQRDAVGWEEDELSIVDPYKYNLILGTPSRARTQVIVDNSIKSLKTLNHVIYRLREHNRTVRHVMKLVDFEDLYELELHSHLDELGLRLETLFRLTDIIESFSEEEYRRVQTLLSASQYKKADW